MAFAKIKRSIRGIWTRNISNQLSSSYRGRAIPPVKELVLNESDLANIPSPINSNIVLSESPADLDSKKKLAKSQKKAIAGLLKYNEKLALRIQLINIVEK